MNDEESWKIDTIYLKKVEDLIHEASHLYHFFIDSNTNSKLTNDWLKIGHRKRKDNNSNWRGLVHPDSFISNYASFNSNLDKKKKTNKKNNYNTIFSISENDLNFSFSKDGINDMDYVISYVISELNRLPDSFRRIVKNVVYNPGFNNSHVYTNRGNNGISVCEDIAETSSKLYKLESLLLNPNQDLSDYDQLFCFNLTSKFENKPLIRKIDLLASSQYQFITSKQVEIFNRKKFDRFLHLNGSVPNKHLSKFLIEKIKLN